MARRKRSSDIVKFATTRAAKLRSIDPKLDFGDGLSLAAYETDIAAVTQLNDQYNTDLAKLDGQLNALEAREKKLQDTSTRLLAGVGARFTKDSSQYEQAGGTRTSERRKPKKAAAAPAPGA